MVGVGVPNGLPTRKKSGFDPIYLFVEGVRHIVGKLSTKATTFLWEVCSQSYGAPKSRESQLWWFWDSHLGVLGQKAIWMWALWPATKYTIRGKEGGGFPQVRAVVNLVRPCCPWLVLTPKVLQLRINHLVWVLWRLMWVSEACQLFLVPSRSSNTSLYPTKCCELRSMPWLFLFPLFSTWIHIWVPQGIGSASTLVAFSAWVYAFNYIHSNHNYNYIPSHDHVLILRIIFIFLFIISIYNLDFCEVDLKCLTNNRKKASEKNLKKWWQKYNKFSNIFQFYMW
jgi:hypothetical protein